MNYQFWVVLSKAAFDTSLTVSPGDVFNLATQALLLKLSQIFIIQPYGQRDHGASLVSIRTRSPILKLRDRYVHILRIEKMSKCIRIYHFQNIFVAAWTERHSILYKCFQCSFNRLEKWFPYSPHTWTCKGVKYPLYILIITEVM